LKKNKENNSKRIESLYNEISDTELKENPLKYENKENFPIF